MENDKQQQDVPKDIALDVPAEANTEKHINFLDAEDESSSANEDTVLTERQKQWKEGLKEGEQARKENES